MPNPPSCMRQRITAWPKPVKYVPVSTRINPVTQVADVAVNSASTQESSPMEILMGRWRNTVPMRIITAKKMIGRDMGGRCFFIGMIIYEYIVCKTI